MIQLPQLTIRKVKEWFFDRKAVVDRIEKKTRKYLALVGYKIRREARKSMRKVRPGGRPSPPGKPPRSRVGYLRDFLYFSYDPTRKTVVVGPALLPGGEKNPTIPELHEFGGAVTRVVYEEAGWRTVGGRPQKKFQQVRRRLRYPARPYMQPAFKKIQPDMPRLWKEILGRT